MVDHEQVDVCRWVIAGSPGAVCTEPSPRRSLPHHGQQFPAEHLTSSHWGIVAYDAVITAATALHNTAAHGSSPSGIPNHYAVRNELYVLRNNAVAGAGGHFGIDKNGNRTNTDSVTTVHGLGKSLSTMTRPGN
ncbi:hypothetical protein ACFV83_29590 [Streptomyces pharetrae]|uniref:hypothetical protein n=1 Tax=Streptomyces pharetrae TaxID=291370 RepID=UPI0036586CFA